MLQHVSTSCRHAQPHLCLADIPFHCGCCIHACVAARVIISCFYSVLGGQQGLAAARHHTGISWWPCRRAAEYDCAQPVSWCSTGRRRTQIVAPLMRLQLLASTAAAGGCSPAHRHCPRSQLPTAHSNEPGAGHVHLYMYHCTSPGLQVPCGIHSKWQLRMWQCSVTLSRGALVASSWCSVAAPAHAAHS